MRRVVLAVGHTMSRPGACNQAAGICEWEWNDELADMIISRNDGSLDFVKKLRVDYDSLPAEINALEPHLVLELHCNAANRTATGTETLYCAASKRGERVAKVIQAMMVGALGLKSRGIVPVARSGRGGHLLWNTDAPAVITEPFFIDNDEDFSLAQRRKEVLADALWIGITRVVESL